VGREEKILLKKRLEYEGGKNEEYGFINEERKETTKGRKIKGKFLVNSKFNKWYKEIKNKKEKNKRVLRFKKEIE